MAKSKVAPTPAGGDGHGMDEAVLRRFVRQVREVCRAQATRGTTGLVVGAGGAYPGGGERAWSATNRWKSFGSEAGSWLTLAQRVRQYARLLCTASAVLTSLLSSIGLLAILGKIVESPDQWPVRLAVALASAVITVVVVWRGLAANEVRGEVTRLERVHDALIETQAKTPRTTEEKQRAAQEQDDLRKQRQEAAEHRANVDALRRKHAEEEASMAFAIMREEHGDKMRELEAQLDAAHKARVRTAARPDRAGSSDGHSALAAQEQKRSGQRIAVRPSEPSAGPPRGAVLDDEADAVPREQNVKR
jgi:hypothetical protein